MRHIVLLVLTLWILPSTVSAQGTLPGPAPSALFGYRARAERIDTVRRHMTRSHWKEGAVVGGAIGGIAGLLLGNHLCGLAQESTRHCTGATLLSGVIGAALVALPGALIGGQFSKSRPPEPIP